MNRKVPLIVLAGILLIGVFVGLIVSSRMNMTNPSVAGSNSKKENSSIPDNTNIDNSGKAFSQIAKEVTPTVVTITSEKKAAEGEGFDQIFKKFHKDMPEQGVGSGVIVREDGYILTNNHVVNESERITVKLFDKRVLQAKVLGSDPLTDIALIKVDAEGLPVTKFGNSDQLQVGEWVLAVGSPLTLNSTVTAGIVSAIGRQIDIIGDQYGVESFIQTDAVINPGNSGGALVNIRGELIGINTAIATKTGLYQGYGFAVPVNIARDVMEDIIKYGKAVRGYIGVGIKEVDATYAKAVGLGKAQGVLVESLTDNAAAKESDIHEGDVILEIDNRPIDKPNDLQAYVALKKPGDVVKLLIYQNGNKTLKAVTLKSIDGKTTPPTIGVKENDVKENEEEIGNGMGFEVQEIGQNGNANKGLVIITSSWHAKEQEIYEGFILTKVNNKSVSSLDEYQSLIKNFKNGDAVVIQLASAQSRDRRIITAIEVKKKK
jgi:serine protease Do